MVSTGDARRSGLSPARTDQRRKAAAILLTVALGAATLSGLGGLGAGAWAAPAPGATAAQAPVLTAAAFAQPPTTVRPKYRFWVPLADTEDAELEAEVGQLAEAGAGGLELVGFQDTGPNPDLATIGFGTPRWTHQLQVILAAAARYGLSVDQNLGPNYPPTVPTVTDINDPAAAKQLVYATQTVPSGTTYSAALPAVTAPSGATTSTVAVVAARCVTLGCLDLGGPKKLERSTVVDLTSRVQDGRITWTAPTDGGTWTLFNFQQTADGTSKSGFSATGTNYVVDHLSVAGAKALTSFYDAQIMTPETQTLVDALPTPGGFFEDSLEMGSNQLWTTGFGEEFAQRRGYQVAPALPALTGSGQQGTTTPAYDFSDGSGDRIRRDYRQTWSDLYVGNYVATLTSWAHTHGMQFRVQSYGDPIQTGAAARVADIPEGESIDFGSPNPLGAEQNYRVVAGGAHSAGKTLVSAECCGIFFGAYRTTAGGRDSNQDGNLTAGITGNIDSVNKAFAGGVNHLVWHGFPYLKAPLGQAVVGQGGVWPGYNPWVIGGAIDVGEMFGPRIPQWSDYRTINDQLARTQLVLRQGAPALDLSVYYQDLGLTGQSVSPPESPAHQLPTTGPLTTAGYTFEYHPPLAYLAADSFGSGLLFPGKGSEKALVLNNQSTMPLDVAQRFLALAKNGLKVVIIGAAPTRVPGDAGTPTDQALIATIAQLRTLPTVKVVADEAGAVSALRALGVRPAAAMSQDLAKPFESVRRDAGDIQYYWLYNPDGTARTQQVTLAGGGRPYLLDSWSGEITPVAQYTATSSAVTMPVTVPPYSAVIYAVTTQNTSPFANSPKVHAVSSTGIPVCLADGTVAVRSTRPGTVTTALSNGHSVATEIPSVGAARNLDTWTLTAETWTPGANYYETTKTMQAPVALTAQSDGTLPAWTTIPGLTLASGIGTYTATVDLGQGWTGGYGATLDLGSAVDTVSVTVNGRPLEAINPSSLTVPASYLQEGPNSITVRVATTLFNAVQSNTLQPSYLTKAVQQYGLIGPVTLRPYGQAPITKAN